MEAGGSLDAVQEGQQGVAVVGQVGRVPLSQLPGGTRTVLVEVALRIVQLGLDPPPVSVRNHCFQLPIAGESCSLARDVQSHYFVLNVQFHGVRLHCFSSFDGLKRSFLNSQPGQKGVLIEVRLFSILIELMRRLLIGGEYVVAVYAFSVDAILEDLIAKVVWGGSHDIIDIEFVVTGLESWPLFPAAQVLEVRRLVLVVEEVLLVTPHLLPQSSLLSPQLGVHPLRGPLFWVGRAVLAREVGAETRQLAAQPEVHRSKHRNYYFISGLMASCLGQADG